MRWIIISSDASRLADILSATKTHMPNVTPYVLVRGPVENYDGLGRGSKAQWLCSPGSFRESMMEALNIPRKNGTPERATLLTNDNLIPTRPLPIHDAHLALTDNPEVMCVDLASLPMSGNPIYYPRGGGCYIAFARKAVRVFGSVFRTSDLMSLLSHLEWSCESSMDRAVRTTTFFALRTKTACFESPSLLQL